MTTKLAAVYYLVQGVATAAWWRWMFSDSDARQIFFAPDADKAVLSKFSYPDLAVFVGSSLLAALLAFRGSRWVKYVAWFVFGAACYACVGALTVNWPIGQRPIADAMMFAAMCGSAFLAVWAARR